MNKSFGIKKRKYIHKNKRNKKKPKYKVHKNMRPLQKSARNFVTSYINHHFSNKNIIEDFMYPEKMSATITWYDWGLYKPTVFKPWY